MLQVNLHMKDNGSMTNLKAKVLCTMKIHNLYLVNSITEISIKLESIYFESNLRFWTKYVGLFHEDNKEGQGTLFLSNGDKFEGNFLQDLVSGPGKYIKSNG